MSAPASAHHDVVIVGGGAVGLLLACLLARHGIDVIVVEKRVTSAGRSRAVGIHPPGLAALEAAGVGAAVNAAAVTIREGIATCEGRELGRIRFGDAPVRSMPQHDTEELLEERLAELAPDALRRGLQVVSVRDRGAHVEVTAATADGVPTVFAARYVVGADGVHSTVRGLLGIERSSRGSAVEYVMADSRDTTGLPETALLHLEPGGVVESFPLPNGSRRWVARLPDGPTVMSDAAFESLIRERVGRGIDRETATEPTVFSARQRLAETFVRGRIVLVGDAAHEVSPIGGQGMNLGWLGAVRLERSLTGALSGISPPIGFSEYARSQRAAASRAMRQAAFNMAMGAPSHGLRLRTRNAFARVLTAGPGRRVLAEAFTMRRL